ncbi:hypothetical protein MMC06_005333 [Schaereria dolodes]|nr:hypothetical protein [Schaereria dolodes]
MSKRTVFTTLTPLPTGISRETVMQTLQDHLEMIDLNPLVEERHPIKCPANATAEEYNCTWYQLTDKINYLPGGLYTGKVSYNVSFHNLPIGLQTHCYAPMGLDIKGKWTLGGTLPGEPRQAVELGLGAPKEGLWLREDVDMRCNMLMTGFVKKTLKKAHAKLVDRLVEKAHALETNAYNEALRRASLPASPGSQGSSRFQSSPELGYARSHNSVSSYRTERLSHQTQPSERLSYQTQPTERSSYQTKPTEQFSYQSKVPPGFQDRDLGYQKANAYHQIEMPAGQDEPAELYARDPAMPSPLKSKRSFAYEME